MRAVLRCETSPTRRRAVAGALAEGGAQVTPLASPLQTLTVLRHLHARAQRVDAIVLGWPERGDADGEEVLALLHASAFEHLPVIILADAHSERLQNWRMARPRTSIVPWTSFAEVGQAIEHLLAPAAPAASQDPGQQPLRVLLVDDSATVRHSFSRLLERESFEVITANSVAQARAALEERAVDFVISDYFMPDANGVELLRYLQNDPQRRHIPAAIITGTYSDDIIVESLANGAVECLFKSEPKELFVARVRSLARTIRDRKQVDQERRRLEGILSSVGDGVYGVGPDGTIEFINAAALDLVGRPRDGNLVGQSAIEMLHPPRPGDTDTEGSGNPALAQYYAEAAEVPNCQAVFRSALGDPIMVECTVFPLQVDGACTGSVVAFRDVSARRRLEEQLRWQAEHDSLTRLHNRPWFEQRVEEELVRLRRTGSASLLLFIDLDRFKYINDTAGHMAGDALLQDVAQRLNARLRESDFIARIGGDEYAILMRNVRPEDAERLTDGFRRSLTATPFHYGGRAYRITISIGAAQLDSATLSLSDAFAHADIACHVAKSSGRDRIHIYTEASGQRAALDLDVGWSSRIEAALVENRFELLFQPIMPLRGIERAPPELVGQALIQHQFDRNSDEPRMFEVLLRLRDQNGELIAPGAFLPSAERFGMMYEIDRWVIANAIRALRDASQHDSNIALTINLSTQTLGQPDLVGFVTQHLVRNHVEASSLIFEITESRAIDDLPTVKALLHALRQLGSKIAVDDFGIGFSTFAYLRELEADLLKIDGSIIQGLPDDPLDRTVIASLTSIAEITGKRTVAEWVEDPRTLIALYECGVDYAQGYAVAHPRSQLAPLPPAIVDLPSSVALKRA